MKNCEREREKSGKNASKKKCTLDACQMKKLSSGNFWMKIGGKKRWNRNNITREWHEIICIVCFARMKKGTRTYRCDEKEDEREKETQPSKRREQTNGTKLHSLIRDRLGFLLLYLQSKRLQRILVLFPLLSFFSLLVFVFFFYSRFYTSTALTFQRWFYVGPLSFSRSSILITLTAHHGHWCVIKWIGSEFSNGIFLWCAINRMRR